MRELKVANVDAALPSVFTEIDALAAQCRFADCSHESEPGCAVLAAVENGDVSQRRLANYRQLLRENARHNASLAERRSQDRAFGKHVKQVMNLKKQDRRSGN